MSFFSNIYRLGIKRTSSYILLLFGAGVGYELVCDKGVDRFFEYVNAGVTHAFLRTLPLFLKAEGDYMKRQYTYKDIKNVGPTEE